MITSQKERYIWLDLLKLISIFLVVWGHVIRHCGLSINNWDSVCGWIYSFHMPLFMTLSGYVCTKITDGQSDIHRKFKQLIIPSISLWIICKLIGHNENFWYLKSLFVCYVITVIIYKIRNPYRWLIFTIFCIIIFPITSILPIIGSWKIDFMLPFFILGLYLKKYNLLLSEHIKYALTISIIFFVISWIYWNPNFIYYYSLPTWFDYSALLFNNSHFFHPETVYKTIYRISIGFWGTMTFICGIQLIQQKSKHALLRIAKYGKYSLHIYILQSFIVQFEKIPISFPIDNRIIFYGIYTPLYSAIVVVVCIIIGILLEKFQFVNRFIFGKY